MKKRRIKNDITFAWTITQNGLPEPLDPMLCKVTLVGPLNIECPVEIFSIKGNTIKGVYRARHQTNCGTYTLELSINENRNGELTVDTPAWELIPHTPLGSDESNICTKTIELSSDIKVQQGGGGCKECLTKKDLYIYRFYAGGKIYVDDANHNEEDKSIELQRATFDAESQTIIINP